MFRLILPILATVQVNGQCESPNDVKTYVKLTQAQQDEGALWGANER